MTTRNDEYRTQLLERVRRIQDQQEARGMTDDQLVDAICAGLDLPPSTIFTDEQLEMIAKHWMPSA